MAIDYYQTGKIKTVVKLNLTEMTLNTTGGHWKSTPLETVSGDSKEHDIFKCINKDSNISGPEGTVAYESSDGSRFTLHFDCPWNASNVCNAKVSENSPYKISGNVPPSGADITYSWTITQKNFNQFLDPPVLSQDLISAPKCNLVPFDKILTYINGREFICLKDVFAIKELPHKAKIWCAKHPLFLTPQTKAILTRTLVEKNAAAAVDAYGISDLTEAALMLNRNISQGELSQNKRENLHYQFQEVIPVTLSARTAKLDDMLLCVIQALLNEDLAVGWAAAADAFLNEVNPNGMEERAEKLIRMIEERL